MLSATTTSFQRGHVSGWKSENDVSGWKSENAMARVHLVKRRYQARESELANILRL